MNNTCCYSYCFAAAMVIVTFVVVLDQIFNATWLALMFLINRHTRIKTDCHSILLSELKNGRVHIRNTAVRRLKDNCIYSMYSDYFFMLNSAEHEIFSSYKYKNANVSWHFNI